MGAGIRDRKLFFIINPQAGGGNARSWWEKTRPALDRLGLDYSFSFSEGPGSVSRQVRAAILERGATAVVAVGGDGTLYEAINGMIEQEALLRENLVFVACPAGTACDFGHYAYGRRGEDLLELLLYGAVMPIDIGACDYVDVSGQRRRSYYINSFDAGAGADTCLQVDQGMKWLKRVFKRGKIPFMLAALKVLMSFKYTETVVETAGERLSGEYIIIGVGNGAYAGGSMMLFPAARLDDGLLDLLLVEKRSRLNILHAFSKVYNGGVTGVGGVHYRQVAWVNLRTARPIAVEMDGEVPGYTAAEIRVLPGLLPLLKPDFDRMLQAAHHAAP